MNGQLEISFDTVTNCQRGDRRGRRQSRARWWFERMRQVVDRAMDWQPAPAPRPEQIWFPSAQREVVLTPPHGAPQGEITVCE